MPPKISFEDDVPGEEKEPIRFEQSPEDEEFRKRLSSLPGISITRRQTILLEVGILEDDEEESYDVIEVDSGGNDVIDGNNNKKGEVELLSVKREIQSGEKSSESDQDDDDDDDNNGSHYEQIVRVELQKPPLNSQQASNNSDDHQTRPPLVIQYWQHLPDVVDAGIVKKMEKDQIAMNEAIYEIFKAVRSFYKSLCIIIDVFKTPFEQRFASSHKFICKNLFLNITTITEVTDKLINQLEVAQGDNLQMEPGCIKVVGEFAEYLFEEPFTRYCSNKESQNKALEEIDASPQLSSYLQELQKNPKCQLLPLSAFLLKPMQMLTKWPILLYAVKKYENCIPLLQFNLRKTISRVEALASNCNKFRTQFLHKEKLILMQTQIEWPKNAHYPLTRNKQDIPIFLDKNGFKLWSKLLPNQHIGRTIIFQTTKRSCTIRLVCFDDGSLLLLSPVPDGENKSSQKKFKFRLLNYADRWRLITNSERIIDELQSEVQDRLRRELVKLFKEFNVGLVLLKKPFRIQPSKVLFLSEKNSPSNDIDILSECQEKLPEEPPDSPEIGDTETRMSVRVTSSHFEKNNRTNIPNSKSAQSFMSTSSSSSRKSDNRSSNIINSGKNLLSPSKPKAFSSSFFSRFRSADDLSNRNSCNNKNATKKISSRISFKSHVNDDKGGSDQNRATSNVDVRLSTDQGQPGHNRPQSIDVVLEKVSLASLRKRSEPIALSSLHLTSRESLESSDSDYLMGSSINVIENFYTSPEDIEDSRKSGLQNGISKKLVVKEKYKKKHPDEISVEEGDFVLSTDKLPVQGWMFVKKETTGRSGWIPTANIENRES